MIYPTFLSAILFVLIAGGFVSGCSMQLISSRINSVKGGGSGAATSTVGTCSTSFTPSTGMAAQVVVGQASMTASSADAGGTTNSIGLNGPEEAMVLSNGQLVVSEWVNHRYLFFDTIPTANGTPADYVWGQPDFLTNTTNTGGLGPTSLQMGRRVAWNGTQFFMTDAYNHRILVFNAIPTSPASAPAYVLGQPDMISNGINTGGRSASSIYSYHGSLFADSTRLVVADAYNSRILIYNLPITGNMQAANVVVGQPDFLNDVYLKPPTAASMDLAQHAIIAAGKLIVADRRNNRVIIFNSVPTSNGASADVAVGQPDLVSYFTGTTANSMDQPHSVAVDAAGRLYVSDTSNNRVLVFNSIPTVSGASADMVIGQTVFTSKLANQGGANPSASTLNRPNGIDVTNCNLFVTDTNNHRILVY